MNRLCRDSRTHPLLHKRNDIRKPLPGQIGRVVAAVRRALRKIFPDLKLSNAEILEIVAKAKRAVVEGGGRQDVEIAQTRMSRAAGGDDAKQGDIEAMEIQEPARKDLRFSQNLPQPDRAETESARQYRETERVYGGRAAYDKAKADGRTKLTYGQWVQVRTPNFKKWFGDWEAEATAKSIRDLAPVDATNAKEVVTKKDIENYFRNNGAATNALNGVTASFPVATAGKLYHHRGFPVGRIVGRLKEIFEQSVPFLSEKEALKEGHKAHPNIDSFDHYVGKVSLGSGAESGEYYVRFTVRKEVAGKKGNIPRQETHNVAVSDVQIYEKPATTNLSGNTPEEGSHPAFVDSKLRDFFAKVNPSSVSKVVDPETGEPLVVYHGTTGGVEYINPNRTLSAEEKQAYEKEQQLIFDEYKAKYKEVEKILPAHERYAALKQIDRARQSGENDRADDLEADLMERHNLQVETTAKLVAEREAKSATVEKKYGQGLPLQSRVIEFQLEDNAFDIGRSKDIGVHFATNRAVSEKFSNRLSGGKVFEVFLNIRDLHRVNDLFSRYQGLRSALNEMYNEGLVTDSQYRSLAARAQRADRKDLEDERYWGELKDVTSFWGKLNGILQKKKGLGFVYNNEVEGGGWSYVAMQPTQIKSATENSGAFDPGNPDIRFARSAPAAKTTPKNAGKPGSFEYIFDRMRVLFQDQFLPVKRVQELLQSQGWKMDPDADTYLAEERYHGRAGYRLEKFQEDHVAPLMEKIRDSGVNILELEDYLYAKYAPQRNAHVASINPKMPDGGSGRTNKWAADTLARFEKEGKTAKLEALAKDVRAITKMQRDTIRKEGLEVDEVIDAWELANPDYVPLKGKADDQGHGRAIGTGFNVKGSGTKRALGRSTPATDILANLIAQTGDTLVRAEKARVGRAFYRMVEENPDADRWIIHEQLPSRRAMVNGQVRNVTDFSFPMEPNVITVTLPGGGVRYIELFDKDLAAAMKNVGAQQLHGWAVRTMALATRYLATVSTSLSPDFVVNNFMRDIQMAMINIAGEKSTDVAKRVGKSVPGAMKGIIISSTHSLQLSED